METIVTKSDSKAKELFGEPREVETNCPDILNVESLKELLNYMSEDMILQKIKAQLMVDFRAKVRAMLESQSDGQPTYAVDDIAQMDFSDWVPEARQRKSAEEKAAEILGKLSPDQVKAALAMAEDKSS